MVKSERSHGGSIIIISIVMAVLLMLIPLPDSLRVFRPEWVVLTLIYWTMAVPQRIGVGYAWTVGLLMDVILGSTFGVMAFAYAVVIYVILVFHLQLRQYPIWQQAISVFLLILLLQLVLIITTMHTANWYFWLPAMISMLLWPVIYALLRGVRCTFHVH